MIICKANFNEYVISKAKKIYLATFDGLIDRLEFELDSIEGMGIKEEFIIASNTIQSLNCMNVRYSVCGNIGSLCVSYILGITKADPISLNIPAEMAISMDGHRIPTCIIEHDDSVHFKIKSNSELNLMKKTKQGVCNQIIPFGYKDELIWEYFNKGNCPNVLNASKNLLKQILVLFKPDCIDDLSNIFSIVLSTGVYKDNAEKLIEQGILTIRDCPVTREDIVGLLLNYGFLKFEAYEMAHFIYTGKKLPEKYYDQIQKADVPEWFIPYCSKVKYIFPKSHCAELAILAYKLVSEIIEGEKN